MGSQSRKPFFIRRGIYFFAAAAQLMVVTYLLPQCGELYHIDHANDSVLLPALYHRPTAAASATPTLPLLHKLGSLGPTGTYRHNLRYYDSVFLTAVQFGADARTVLEVGCADDPFVRHISWADVRRCVAPYYKQYDNSTSSNGVAPSSAGGGGSVAAAVERITADFDAWEADAYYDMVICSQVAEHVPNPRRFVRKVLRTARVAIVSVPYMWGPSKTNHTTHVTHHIDLGTIESWTKPKKPVLSTIVKDERDGSRVQKKRIIVVYVAKERTGEKRAQNHAVK